MEGTKEEAELAAKFKGLLGKHWRRRGMGGEGRRGEKAVRKSRIRGLGKVKARRRSRGKDRRLRMRVLDCAFAPDEG